MNSVTRQARENPICVICARPFEPVPAAAGRQLVCGVECRRERKRRKAATRSRTPIPTDGDRVLCPCGNDFPIERDRLGRPTTRRLCPACRTVSTRDRDLAARPDIPEGAPHCSDCGCLTDPDLGGAQPAGDGRCEPCRDWQERVARKALAECHHSDSKPILGVSPLLKAQTVGDGRDTAKLPLWVWGPYRALPAWTPPIWPRRSAS